MPLSDFLSMLEQYRGASAAAPPATVEQDYSQVAQTAPQPHLASGLAEAFRSSETPPFGQMLGTLFGNSNGEQRAGILNTLLGAIGPSMLASGGLSRLAGLLGGGNNVTPEQADQVPPETVQQLAEDAEKQDPSIVDQASAFYAQHPTLVKALGAGSLALIISHLFAKQGD
jgi:hypothetical protein